MTRSQLVRQLQIQQPKPSSLRHWHHALGWNPCQALHYRLLCLYRSFCSRNRKYCPENGTEFALDGDGEFAFDLFAQKNLPFFERNMTTDAPTRIHPMMQIRLIVCAAMATTLLIRTVSGGDLVVVELKSGRRIRAHSIAQDVSHPDHVTLKIGNAQIQMERSIPWQLITRMSAPADQRAELRIPESVMVVEDFEERTALPPAPLLTATPELSNLVPRQGNWNSSWKRPGGCNLLDCPAPHDPGIVVGVRDFSYSSAPLSGLRPDCCRFPIEP